MNNQPIVMFSGMGADSRVFKKQIEEIPEIVVPEWIDPLPSESLRSYARRFADKISPINPGYVGGASFGGFIALEITRYLKVNGCFLIGSVRAPNELPQKIKMLKQFSAATKMIPFELAILLSKVALIYRGAHSENHLNKLFKQLSDSDVSFLRWASRAVLEWDETIDLNETPIHQIHGENDFALPVINTQPDVIIPNAGHAISMSHPDVVTDFIKQKIGWANQSVEPTWKTPVE